MRGATGSGDGVHVLTGPIKVKSAMPGDILKVEVLELTPRPNKDGDTYGVNAAAWWGFHYGVNGNDRVKRVLRNTAFVHTREVTNVYKVVKAYDGPGNLVPAYAEPVYQTVYGGR